MVRFRSDSKCAHFNFFRVYITWMYLVVMYIVPFSLLAVLNLRIYMQVRKANQERAKLSSHQQREIGMATMLICGVIVFFACNVLALVVNVLEVSYVDQTLGGGGSRVYTLGQFDIRMSQI